VEGLAGEEASAGAAAAGSVFAGTGECWDTADWQRLCTLVRALENYESRGLDPGELRGVLTLSREVREGLGRLERNALERLREQS